jgi:hypothetical protein
MNNLIAHPSVVAPRLEIFSPLFSVSSFLFVWIVDSDKGWCAKVLIAGA